jgi:hypothetical protein
MYAVPGIEVLKWLSTPVKHRVAQVSERDFTMAAHSGGNTGTPWVLMTKRLQGTRMHLTGSARHR